MEFFFLLFLHNFCIKKKHDYGLLLVLVIVLIVLVAIKIEKMSFRLELLHFLLKVLVSNITCDKIKFKGNYIRYIYI